MNEIRQYELSSREGRITIFFPPLFRPFNEFLCTGSCLWYKILSQLWHEEKPLKWWDALWPVWIWYDFLKFTRICDFEKTYTVPSFTGSKLCLNPWRTQRQDKVFFPSLSSCSCSLEERCWSNCLFCSQIWSCTLPKPSKGISSTNLQFQQLFVLGN